MINLQVDGKTKKKIIQELLVTTKGCIWGKEMRVLNNLLDKYPDPDFFLFIAKKNRFSSLLHLAADPGLLYQREIEYRKDMINLEKPAVAVPSEEKCGEDVEVSPKKTTLSDFLK